MKAFLAEYGQAVLYSIVVIAVISILFYSLNDPSHGFIFTYNTNMVYANEFLAGTDGTGTPLADHEASGRMDATDNITNVYTTLYKPVFYLDDSATPDDYVIEVPADLEAGVTQTRYTYDEALALFSLNGKLGLLTNTDGSGYVNQGLPNDIEIVIEKLTPTERGTDGELPTEWVEAKDKYGGLMYDADGNQVMVEQVVYNSTAYSRDNIDEFYIDWDEACRYRILYRYTQNTLKCEYSAMFANKIRPAEIIYEEVYTEWVYPD